MTLAATRDEKRTPVLLELERLVAEMTAIHALRAGEGHSVTILCDNPDFDGPNNAVEVCADWTDWKERRFTGETLLEALQAAIAGRAALEQR